jgi:hypothetical protein
MNDLNPLGSSRPLLLGSRQSSDFKGTPHETEIYVRLQRVDVTFSIAYPDSDNELRLVQERRFST